MANIDISRHLEQLMKIERALYKKHAKAIELLIEAAEGHVDKNSPRVDVDIVVEVKYHLGNARKHLKNVYFLLKCLQLPLAPLIVGGLFRKEARRAQAAASQAELVLIQRLGHSESLTN